MLPRVFCWSKFGTEAGEQASRIIERKERERRFNNGDFLWGIGNSIRPSLIRLLEECSKPEVLFTPMLSRPSGVDVSPPAVVLWREAVGIDGNPFEFPRFTAVTSRKPGGSGPGKHFALVCRSDRSLEREAPSPLTFNAGSVTNLLTGNSVGSSQVTSVVEYSAGQRVGARDYTVAFRARLEYPYLVTLRSPMLLDEQDRRMLDDPSDSVDELAGRLLDLRRSATEGGHLMTLF